MVFSILLNFKLVSINIPIEDTNMYSEFVDVGLQKLIVQTPDSVLSCDIKTNHLTNSSC